MSMFSVAAGEPNLRNNDQGQMQALTDAYKAAHLKLPAPVGNANYHQAEADLKLNPQELSLYERHLKNLNGPGGVDNPDGSRSTLYQANVEHDGKHYNIPTVYDGKILPWREAADRADAQGWRNFPSYNSPDEAEARYNDMHKYMEKDTAEHMANKGAYANARVSRGWEQFAPQTGQEPPMLPTPPTPTPVNMPPPALSAQAMAPHVPPAAPQGVPMPTARPPDAPQPQPDMGFFQRNAAMMQDPTSGAFIDPGAADRAQASGPDVIAKLMSYFHKEGTPS